MLNSIQKVAIMKAQLTEVTPTAFEIAMGAAKITREDFVQKTPRQPMPRKAAAPVAKKATPANKGAKPREKHAVSKVAVVKQKPTLDTLLATLRREEFSLSFKCFLKDIPRGVQVLPACGCATNSKQQGVEVGNYRNVVIDLKNLLNRVYISGGINVVNRQGYCLVYMNCTTGRNHDGLDFWGKKKGNKVYDELVHEFVKYTWGNAVLREYEGKTSLSLRNYSKEPPKAVIRFAIEKATE